MTHPEEQRIHSNLSHPSGKFTAGAREPEASVPERRQFEWPTRSRGAGTPRGRSLFGRTLYPRRAPPETDHWVYQESNQEPLPASGTRVTLADSDSLVLPLSRCRLQPGPRPAASLRQVLTRGPAESLQRAPLRQSAAAAERPGLCPLPCQQSCQHARAEQWRWWHSHAACVEARRGSHRHGLAATRNDGARNCPEMPAPCPRICPRDPLRLALSQLRRVITRTGRMWPLCRDYVGFRPGDCDA